MSHYLQLAINGISENKEFNKSFGLPCKEIRRINLAEFIRNKLGCNKVTFARMIDVSPATVTKWLYSDAEPKAHVIKRIARCFGLSVDEVLTLFEVTEVTQ